MEYIKQNSKEKVLRAKKLNRLNNKINIKYIKNKDYLFFSTSETTVKTILIIKILH